MEYCVQHVLHVEGCMLLEIVMSASLQQRKSPEYIMVQDFVCAFQHLLVLTSALDS